MRTAIRPMGRVRRLRRVALWLAAAAISLAVFAPPSASADVVRSDFYRDGNDTTEGMDIRLTGLVIRVDPVRVTFRIRTFERINMPDAGQFYVHLDAFGGPKWDYGFHIQYDGGSSGLFCDGLWREGLHRGPQPERWDVSGSLAWCQLGRFPRHDKPIRFKTWSTGWDHDYSVINDRAPDGGRWYS